MCSLCPMYTMFKTLHPEVSGDSFTLDFGSHPAAMIQDIQNKQAQLQDLLPAGAKRSIADFGNGYDYTTWKVTHLGGDDTAAEKAFDRGQNIANTSVNKHGNFRFKGTTALLCVRKGSVCVLAIHSPRTLRRAVRCGTAFSLCLLKQRCR